MDFNDLYIYKWITFEVSLIQDDNHCQLTLEKHKNV